MNIVYVVNRFPSPQAVVSLSPMKYKHVVKVTCVFPSPFPQHSTLSLHSSPPLSQTQTLFPNPQTEDEYSKHPGYQSPGHPKGVDGKTDSKKRTLKKSKKACKNMTTCRAITCEGGGTDKCTLRGSTKLIKSKTKEDTYVLDKKENKEKGDNPARYITKCPSPIKR